MRTLPRWNLPSQLVSTRRRQPTSLAYRRTFLSMASSIVGTAPQHSLYALLEHSKSPQTYEPKVNTPELMALMRAVRPSNGLANFWHPVSSSAVAESEGNGEHMPPKNAQSIRIYAAPRPGEIRPRVARLRLPSTALSASSLDAGNALGDLNSTLEPARAADGALLLVCTHGQRDCRCGTHGGELFEALRSKLDRRRQQGSETDKKLWETVEIGEVAHVGGHK